jgi:poly-gamma-glutamate capsule biosynthesis protein CapA/YwtB (metallophosphatase superfamily)
MLVMVPAAKRRRLTEVLLGVAAVLGVAVGASVALGRGERPSPAPTAQPNAKSSSGRALPATAPLGSAPSLTSAPPLPAPLPPKPLVIVAGGDVNFGRECGQAILADSKYDPFRFMGTLWGDADVRFVNVESQLSDQQGETQSPRNRLVFTGPPGGANTLAQAGIGVVSTANNHAWDYGRGALFETIDNLKRAGVKQAGIGRTLDEAYAPAVVEVGGRRVAVVAVTQIWNAGEIDEHEGRKHVAWARPNRVRAALERARREADIVLLSYHGGAEYIDAPVPPTRKFIDSVVKTGLVDVVIGHHPHVMQGVGFVRGKPVFYSLGNFVFAGHNWAPWTLTGLVARIEVDAERAVKVSACAVALDGHVPKPIPPGDARLDRVREHLRDTSTSVGGITLGAADARGCFPITPPAR